MKIACSGSAFPCSLEEMLKRVSALRFDFVDLIAIPGWGQIELAQLAEDYNSYSKKIQLLLEKYELTPIGMNMGIPATYLRDPETITERNKQLEAAARLMKQLNISVASFYPGYKTEDLPRDVLVRATAKTFVDLKRIQDKYGVEFLIEPHFDTPYQTLGQIKELIDQVPDLKITYDPSHFAMQGLDVRDTEFLLDRTVHVHVRDAAPGKMQISTGMGTVDFLYLNKALKQRDYSGYCSIEVLSQDGIQVENEINQLRSRMV